MYNKNLNKMTQEQLRMQMLAGIITESEYKAKLNENSNWQDYGGYKSILDQYFNTYDLDNLEEFELEVYENGDAMNNLAYDIAQKAGFKGSYSDFIDETTEDDKVSDFGSYCNALAKLFLLKFGVDTGVVDSNNSEYQKELQNTNQWVNKYKNKFNNFTYTQSPFPGKKNPLIDYSVGDISPDEIKRFGDYDEESNTFEVEQGSDAMADFYDDVYKGTDMNWWEDEDNIDDLSDFYTYSLEKAIKEKYGNDVNIEYY